MENAENFEIAEDLRQSNEYGKYIERIGWRAVKFPHQDMQIFIRKLGPVRVAKLQRTSLSIPWKNVDNILTSEKVMMCTIEPLLAEIKEFGLNGYKTNKEPLLGTKTLRVNLRPKEEEIFNSFKKDCRYIIRKLRITNHKLQINDFDNFYDIWKKSAKRKRLWIPGINEYKSLIGCFGKNVFCLTIDNLAGALILLNKKTAFYYYAGATGEGTVKDLPYAVVWNAMLEAKKRGCQVWDFEGIYDARWPNKSWAGFSHFKKSFGGKEIEFPGSFTKWRWPF